MWDGRAGEVALTFLRGPHVIVGGGVRRVGVIPCRRLFLAMLCMI